MANSKNSSKTKSSKSKAKSVKTKSRNTTNSGGNIKQKASRRAFKQNVQAKMKQGKSKEQAIKESQKIQQRNK